MNRLTLDETRELLPAYALGALEPAEIAEVDAVLARHPELQPELDEFRRTTAAIFTGPPVTPPPALRERFLERLATETPRELERGAVSSGAPATGTPPLTVMRGDPSRDDRQRTPATRTPSRAARWALPGALVMALAASLVLLLDTRRDLLTLRAALVSREQRVAERDARIVEQERQLATLLGAEGTLLVVDLGAPQTTGPGMRFFWNVQQGRGLLHAYRLPPAPAGRTYQLWLIRDGKPVPSQLFNSDQRGRTVVADIQFPTSADGVSAVAITEEPAGGSAQPTTQPFLVGAIRSTE